LSGKSIRASCGLKAPAHSERISEVFELCLLRVDEAEVDDGMKDSSRREVRYCVRFEAISFSV
jgi:hypothetical protein